MKIEVDLTERELEHAENVLYLAVSEIDIADEYLRARARAALKLLRALSKELEMSKQNRRSLSRRYRVWEKAMQS